MPRTIKTPAICGNPACQRRLYERPPKLCHECSERLPIRLREAIATAETDEQRVDAVWIAGAFLRDRACDGEAYCIVCGCTENHACEGGCYWSEDPRLPLEDVCSACVGQPI